MRPAPRILISRAACRPWVPADRQLRRWVRATLQHAPRGRLDHALAAVVSVRIVGAHAARTLNARYRGKDRPTNVLSFPGPGALASGEQLLGDLVICAPVIAREAREQRKAAAAHWAHIVIHGALHLLGFDHRHSREARVMEALEVRVLAGLGIADPYRQ